MIVHCKASFSTVTKTNRGNKEKERVHPTVVVFFWRFDHSTVTDFALENDEKKNM